MPSQPVDLPGSVALLFGEAVTTKLATKRQHQPHLPTEGQILNDLRLRSSQGGVPATVRDDRGNGAALRLYPGQYVVILAPTREGDAYRAVTVGSVRMSDHEQLIRGHLLVRARDWVMYADVRDVRNAQRQRPGVHQRIAPDVDRAWRALRERAAPEGPPPGLPQHHERFLDTLAALVEVTRKIEQEAAKTKRPAAYGDTRSAAEERKTARTVWEFQLAAGARLENRESVEVDGHNDLRGTVIRVDRRWATVRFDRAVDVNRIKRQGQLQPALRNTSYNRQLEAIAALRDGSAHNSRLLSVLVDRSYASFQPDPTAQRDGLDAEQFEALQRALAVPDLLLVLGPPGTGKTHTIRALCKEQAGRDDRGSRRVLISSRNHKAVDNALAGLPDTVLAVRVGREEKVTDATSHLLLETLATSIQATVLQRTAATAERLAPFGAGVSAVDAWLKRLKDNLSDLQRAGERLDQLERELATAEQGAGTPLQGQLNQLAATLADQERELTHVSKRAVAWRRRHERAVAWRQQPVLALLRRWLEPGIRRREEAANAALGAAGQRHDQTRRAYEQADQERSRLLRGDPEVRRCRAGIRLARALGDQHRAACTVAADAVRQAMLPAVDGADVPAAPESQPGLEAFASWALQTRTLLERRARLLESWRAGLERRTEQLYPELLRHADVVASTCIGVATEEAIGDVEFDLAIIDEAGQVCLNDVLVPLVRTRRAVLVGDHKQLPPYVDHDVTRWLTGDVPAGWDVAQAQNLLTQSAFEQLFDRTPDTNLVRLRQQRRMPAVLADFVALHFYGGRGQLETKVDRPHDDPIFTRPLAIVDTSSLSPASRCERRPGHGRRSRTGEEEPGSETYGWENPTEAWLLAELATVYEQAGADYAVILPYRAQADLVADRLRHRLGRAPRQDIAVGTVDSFQGGQRGRILYGLTRSNDRGEIGFLKELRRLNVALTRARSQLVVVGDMATATDVRDPGFRDVMRSLLDHTGRHGEVLTSDAARRRLDAIRERPA